MSERPIFTPSGLLSRGLALAARNSPQGLNVILAAGYGICEVLGAGALLSTLWPFLQSTVKERFHAIQNPSGNKQGAPKGSEKIQDSHVP